MYRSCRHQLAQWFPDFKLGSTACYSAEFGPWILEMGMPFCTGRIHWSKKSCPSQCSCKHSSTGDGNSFSFVIWKSWRKSEEKMEKIWRIFLEHFSFAILLYILYSVSRGLVRLATCDLYRFRLESLWNQPTSRGTGDFDLTYRGRAPLHPDVVGMWFHRG